MVVSPGLIRVEKMGRIRTVKPEFYADEDLSELAPETHLLAGALLNYADDKGFFNANPKLVKANCCPLREDSVSIHESLNELSRVGYIALGQGSDGKRYGFIRTFGEHQRINRPTPSKIEGVSITWDDSLRTHGGLNEDSQPEGKGTGKGTGKGKEVAPTGNRSTPAPAADSPVFITLTLNDKSEHPVTEADLAEYAELYPAVDIRQQVRNMRGWLNDNPKRRKTASGIRRFIGTWLSKEQDKGGNGSRGGGPDNGPRGGGSGGKLSRAVQSIERRRAGQ